MQGERALPCLMSLGEGVREEPRYYGTHPERVILSLLDQATSRKAIRGDKNVYMLNRNEFDQLF